MLNEKEKILERFRDFVKLPEGRRYSGLEDYGYSFEWDEADKIFVVRVAEYPGLGAHGDTPASAFACFVVMFRDVLFDLRLTGEPVRAPGGGVIDFSKSSPDCLVKKPEVEDEAILVASLAE